MRLAVVTGLVSACGFSPAGFDGVQADAQVAGDGGVVARTCHSTVPDLRLCLDFEQPRVEDDSPNMLAVSATLVDSMPRLSQRAAAMSIASAIDVPESPALNIAHAVTVEMFVRVDAPYDDAYVLDNVGEYTLGIQGDALYCDIAAHSVWTHVACTYDGATIRGYVDGNVVMCRDQTGQIANGNTNGIAIGGGFVGGLDDIHVYARALADADIQKLAAVPMHPTKCPSSWQF
jgi:hypothetical protein